MDWRDLNNNNNLNRRNNNNNLNRRNNSNNNNNSKSRTRKMTKLRWLSLTSKRKFQSLFSRNHGRFRRLGLRCLRWYIGNLEILLRLWNWWWIKWVWLMMSRKRGWNIIRRRMKRKIWWLGRINCEMRESIWRKMKCDIVQDILRVVRHQKPRIARCMTILGNLNIYECLLFTVPSSS